MQAVILVAIGLLGHPLPPTGSFLTGAPFAELLIGIAVLCVASMCLGLMVSALVSTTERAMPFLVLITMVQVVLSGGVVSIAGKMGLEQVAWLVPGRWGFAAVASTADLNHLVPARVHALRPAVAASGEHLADGHGRDDRPVGRVRGHRLVAAEPAQPGPPQVDLLTERDGLPIVHQRVPQLEEGLAGCS